MAKRNTPKVPPAPAAGPDAPKSADAAAAPADLTLGTPDPAPAAPDASAPPAPAPEDTKTAKPKLPESVTMEAPHGFVDDDGMNRHWHQDAVVINPDEIALLISRRARLVGITYEE